MSMMGIKRSIKCSQPDVTELTFLVTGATAAVGELDASQVASVTHSAVGKFTFIFQKNSILSLQNWAVVAATFVGAIGHCVVNAVASDRVTVWIYDSANALADLNFYLTVKGTDSKILY